MKPCVKPPCDSRRRNLLTKQKMFYKWLCSHQLANMDLKTIVMSSFCLLFLLLTNMYSLVKSEQQLTNEFTVVNNKKADTVLKTITNISKMKCAMACGRELKSGGCSLANYNGDSKTCELTADSLQNAVEDPTAQWKIIVPVPGNILLLWCRHFVLNIR